MGKIRIVARVAVVVGVICIVGQIYCLIRGIETEGVITERSDSLFPLDVYNLLFLVPEKGEKFKYRYRVQYNINGIEVKVSGKLPNVVFNDGKGLEKFLRKYGFEKYAIIGGELREEEKIKRLLEEFNEEEVEMVCDGGEVEVWSMSISRFYYNPRKRTFLLWWWKLTR